MLPGDHNDPLWTRVLGFFLGGLVYLVVGVAAVLFFASWFNAGPT